MYLENNYEKIKETKVLSHERVRVNDEEYKVDINDYTGSDVNYIFFNVSNGRLVIQKGKRLTIEKFDVEVV
jgi:dUTPase